MCVQPRDHTHTPVIVEVRNEFSQRDCREVKKTDPEERRDGACSSVWAQIGFGRIPTSRHGSV